MAPGDGAEHHDACRFVFGERKELVYRKEYLADPIFTALSRLTKHVRYRAPQGARACGFTRGSA